ncbi:putative mitochondrial import inner membrane translocase subunit tim13 protein [Lasiodiplodia theobromae]|uniref:Mitochondrial import inner membrane translocase subunit n=2 Tax=Lasiodiplodia TaxID=66739 RepID=A0A5N5DHA4_9PEZI|nr:Mitochondrial import protein [Lasiodiplodia theobromae]KAB2577238.1 Mitochondrial import inner membrane translocase subunit TIM13 [Lasiodiplodia theobromae]KAF4538761.1 Mitochondrial import protein [Lasiodiplodia theobromae]KAF9637550.1 putative mitochondrial import inner membrane translocase subunit tim13 protein [Lasiodiplodia theobromae]KAK0637920.1 Mitochondrial import inner membrane translocase subunit TIM13 [Lasiodiplodia hormozganensis]
MDSLNISSSDPKVAVMQQVRQEAAVANARQLVEKLNEHCFERCVPKPGTSLSKGEETCFTQCMEKYMAAWNVVSRQYVAKLQQNSAGGMSL